MAYNSGAASFFLQAVLIATAAFHLFFAEGFEILIDRRCQDGLLRLIADCCDHTDKPALAGVHADGQFEG